MCEGRNNKLTDINDFFEKETEISFLLQKFWDSYEFNKMISKSYAEFSEVIAYIQTNVPEQLEEEAKNIWRDINYTEDSLKDEVKKKFKIFLYESITEISSNSCFFYTVMNHTFFANNYKKAVEVVEKLTINPCNTVIIGYFNAVYVLYVPEGMTVQEAARLRMECGGGVIVPITSFFPELFKK